MLQAVTRTAQESHPQTPPPHKKVHQGHVLLSILVYIFDVCVQAVKRLLGEGVNQEVMLGSST